jgi:probable F420-dependent oxidoreductase
MQIGVVFPQTEIGEDPEQVARFATTAEAVGYRHLLAYDHVIGANTASRPDWTGPYTSKSLFHEPFVLFGFLAGLTQRIGFATGVLILPQRQTALVAKQAASLDVLCSGRLRLGIGTGWNPVEYEVLEQNFRDRGKRSEEQIEVLRRLWAEGEVEYDGRWHRIPDAGINPLPPNRRIPIWIGGFAPLIAERVGRLADGWLPMDHPGLPADIQRMRQTAKDHGRDPDSIGIECIIPPSATHESARNHLRRLEDAGVSHVSVSMMNIGIQGAQAHIDTLQGYWDAVGDLSD